MDSTITYEVTPELQKESVRAYFRHAVLKKKWIGVLGFLLAGGLLCALRPSELDLYVGIGLGAIGLVLLLTWLKEYQGHMKITVTLTEQDITIDRVTSRQQTEWSKVSRVVDAGAFMVLLSGKLPIGNLPKRFLDEEQLDFIESHTKRLGMVQHPNRHVFSKAALCLLLKNAHSSVSLLQMGIFYFCTSTGLCSTSARSSSS